MIKIDDGGDWDNLIVESKSTGEKIRTIIQRRVSETAMEAVRNVKTAMPVDTGRARASWGSPEAEGIFEYQDDGFTNIQGTNVHYVVYLNEGHSLQAPAGFIDAEEFAANERLAAALAADLETLL